MVVRVLKERKEAGSIVTLPMVKAGINLVVAQKAKSVKSIQPVVQRPVRVKKKVKEKAGAKKPQGEKRNELNQRTIKNNHQRIIRIRPVRKRRQKGVSN